jgi:prolipoprotein diacylglyceryl transferase
MYALTAVGVPAFIPSPDQGVWHLGPVPIRAYALCILLGIFVGYQIGKRRWVARGGKAEVAADMIFWAVPFGLVGSRIYHVLTDPELYFGEGQNWVDIFKIWHGGLGIWGGIAFGALGAWIACRRHGVPFLAMADAFAPGIVVAQAIGRWGNWFNQELFGRPTTLPWALEIAPEHRPPGYEQYATFHPTFLYECLWNLGVAGLVILVDRRFKLGHGRAFALYVAAYTAGRGWIEYMRIDTVNHIAGLRLNVWTSIILFLAAIAFFVVSARRRPGREDLTAQPAGTTPEAVGKSSTSGSAEAAPADAEPGTTPEASAASSSPASAKAEPQEAPAEADRAVESAEADPAHEGGESVEPQLRGADAEVSEDAGGAKAADADDVADDRQPRAVQESAAPEADGVDGGTRR